MKTQQKTCVLVAASAPVATRRFFFFSRGEERLHIVSISRRRGEVLDRANDRPCSKPGLSDQDLRRVEQSIEQREQEIRAAWADHFGS
jgi:hypothetical protein